MSATGPAGRRRLRLRPGLRGPHAAGRFGDRGLGRRIWLVGRCRHDFLDRSQGGAHRHLHGAGERRRHAVPAQPVPDDGAGRDHRLEGRPYRRTPLMFRRSFIVAGRPGAGPAGGRPAAAHQDRADLRQDRSARGLCAPDRGGLHAGAGIRDPGHDGNRRPQDPGHPEGRPAEARPRQGRPRAGLWRRQGRHRRRHLLVGRARSPCCRSPRNTRSS